MKTQKFSFHLEGTSQETGMGELVFKVEGKNLEFITAFMAIMEADKRMLDIITTALEGVQENKKKGYVGVTRYVTEDLTKEEKN